MSRKYLKNAHTPTKEARIVKMALMVPNLSKISKKRIDMSVKNFVQYLLERELNADSELISESADQPKFGRRELKKFLKKSRESLRARFRARYENRHPKAQREDIEEAFEDAIKKTELGKPKSEKSAQRILKREMEKNINGIGARKKDAKKNLSCVGAIRNSSGESKPIEALIKRAERLLTSQERKVLGMCSGGKTVREIGSEMGISFPTAWRVLNSAIDKIRISHGMSPRHKDMRKSLIKD